MINYIYNQMFYLQESGILLGGCLTVKNKWGLLTGDDGAEMLISAFRSRKSISGPELAG